MKCPSIYVAKFKKNISENFFRLVTTVVTNRNFSHKSIWALIQKYKKGGNAGDVSNSVAKNLFLCDLGFRWCMLEKEWGICGRNRQLLQLIEIVTRSSCFVNSETI